MSQEIHSISIVGSRGRMGRALNHLIGGEFRGSARTHIQLHSQSPEEDWADALASDVWVDFSLPAGIHAIHAKLTACLASHPGYRLPALVIGTTGHSRDEKELIDELAALTLVLQAANFSIGILILKKALEFVSPILWKSSFRPVLVETHHIHKKDSPSGTAWTLAESTSGLDPARIHSIRAGEVIGDHQITFHGLGEQLSLSHHAASREIFARGALEAAIWIARKRALAPTRTGAITLDQFFEEKLACLTSSK